MEASVVTDGLTITFDNDSTEEDTRIAVTGNGINGINYDEDAWGTLPDNVYLAAIQVNLPVEDGKKYRLISRSPVHQYYFGKDDRIKKEGDGYYKIQENIATGEIWPIVTGLTNRKGDTTLELYEMTDTGNKKIRQVTITNGIDFAKKLKIELVDDEPKKVTEIAINEFDNTVEDLDKVVSGDVICIKADDAKMVKFGLDEVYRDPDGWFQYTVTKNTTITVV
ncbi:MAG: hypothetical protein NC548_25770 [Lachnospiraceae bacterium]|nr:hypothetical protein [Lachnospiraceae bacterium]